ncbi:hypothetical protein EIP91_003640 [Steccherinum ochraceum]|uniref:Pseudouridine synthase RsuA/RluA-like domain-containing protein n=1 Tax=Steccherinum ochraceum TaxID=92696 RepID=A0A4R0RA66_9APHY|nr:hypothetical protein EIP91_003640 [Steccherinum ochraceum]
MLLQYLFAAITAFLPLLPIFRQSTLVNWTLGLASSVIPRYISPPVTPELPPPPGVVTSLDTAEEIDLSLSIPPPEIVATALELELKVHPALHAVVSIGGALVHDPDFDFLILRNYLPDILLVLAFGFGGYLLVSVFKRYSRRSTPSSSSAEYCEAAAALEAIDRLGCASAQNTDVLVDQPLPLTPVVTVTPPDGDISSASIDSEDLPCDALKWPPLIPKKTEPSAPVHLAVPDLLDVDTLEASADGVEPTPETRLTTLVDECAEVLESVFADSDMQVHDASTDSFVLAEPCHTVQSSVSTLQASFESRGEEKDLAAPDVSQPSSLPEPLELPELGSLDLAVLQEITLFGDDILTLKEESLLDVQLSEIDRVEISTSNDTLVSEPSDTGHFLPLKTDGTADSSNVNDAPCVSVSAADMQVECEEHRPLADADIHSEADALLSAPLIPETADTPPGKLTTDVADFCFTGPLSAAIPPSLVPAPPRTLLLQDLQPSSSAAIVVAGTVDLFSAFRCAMRTNSQETPSSPTPTLDDLSPLDGDDFVLINSPDLDAETAYDLARHALQTDVALPSMPLNLDSLSQPGSSFPLIEPDEAVLNILGETLDRRDWTLVNIHLNEDSRYVYSPAPMAPSVAVLDQTGLERSLPVGLFADPIEHSFDSSHSRTGSDEPRRRPGTSLVSTRTHTVSLPHQSEDFRLLSMRLGLIHHEKDFHMFEPVAELRIAIQGERAALAVANIPRLKPTSPTRLNYGLTQAEFLRILTKVQTFIPGLSYSYAERLRHNLPQTNAQTLVTLEPHVDDSKPRVPIIVHVNKNRGGQDSRAEAANQIDLDRQRAKEVADRPDGRHGGRRSSPLLTRARRGSMAATTVATATAEPTFATILNKSRATSEPPTASSVLDADVKIDRPLVSSSSDLRRTKSVATLGLDRSNVLNSSPQSSRERNHRRASSGSTNATAQCSSTSDGRPRRGRRSSESIYQPPPLETIAGSPPESPKTVVPEKAAVAVDTSSPLRVLSVTPRNLSYPRIDDEGVMNEVPIRFDWASSFRTDERSSTCRSCTYTLDDDTRPAASTSRVHYPLIDIPDTQLFRHVLTQFFTFTGIMAAAPATAAVTQMTKTSTSSSNGLRKIPPYWYAYTTMAKGRWLGRKILEVVSSEFRDRSMDFYRYALESGVTTINGVVAKPDTIVRNGDRIENVVHRHEPPVTDKPVKVLLHDAEREFIVVEKPGSIPVHPAGRYFKNTLVEILQSDFGFTKVYTVNRLDRLTSGLMILPTSAVRANELTQEFFNGQVGKVYVARCKGRFPEHEVICEKPLLTVDRQMGLNIVHPEGKPAKTVFNLIRYDANTDTSVLRCKPLTGRSHQIRVHLQFLGHPIANDPVYSEKKIWGVKLGKGGLDMTPSDERSAPQAPPQFQFTAADNPEALQSRSSTTTTPSPDAADGDNNGTSDNAQGSEKPALLPRETGHDIGLASPVPLSAEAVKVITGLRNMKDEDEDWSRWRDVVFRAKTALVPNIQMSPLPPQNRRKRGGPVKAAEAEPSDDTLISESTTASVRDTAEIPHNAIVESVEIAPEAPSNQLTAEEAVAKLRIVETGQTDEVTVTEVKTEEMHYCPECYLPIHPDPKPERLYIFLHALRYTTSLGSFETEMPEWAAEGWEWDRT